MICLIRFADPSKSDTNEIKDRCRLIMLWNYLARPFILRCFNELDFPQMVTNFILTMWVNYFFFFVVITSLVLFSAQTRLILIFTLRKEGVTILSEKFPVTYHYIFDLRNGVNTKMFPGLYFWTDAHICLIKRSIGKLLSFIM